MFTAFGTRKDKIAAGFTNSASRSGNKLATLTQFAIVAAQHGMHWINFGLPPGNNSMHGSDQDLNRLGFWLGAAAVEQRSGTRIRSTTGRTSRRARGEGHAATCAWSFACSRRLGQTVLGGTS
jgi:multimeric flavodoxin WrbA